MSAGTPEAEVEIDSRLVRGLLRDQHPDLAELPIRLIDSGWDNATYRLGDTLAVRIPRRQVAAPLIEHEQDWLPLLADQLPIPVPSVLRIGRPGRGYPWRWSVLPWFEGASADRSAPDESQAGPLASFLRALHQPAPDEAPPNPARGVPLAERADGVEERLHRLERETDLVTPGVRAAWAAALSAPRASEARWLHGDLHARNVLVAGGVIRAIIDWGDITAGDVATDLASIWMLLEAKSAREEAIEGYAASSGMLARARGWAVLFGAILLETGRVDSPRHALMGEVTLRRITEDA